MFIGRTQELKDLDRLYGSGKFEFVVIYGRRRVGKTALIDAFLQGKKGMYCMGVESSEEQNLENLSESVTHCLTGMDLGTSFSSFQKALETVFQASMQERMVLAIDEYPYMARASKSLASVLQRLIDQYHASSKLMLILCGSSVSYMEDEVLAYKAPLYGRRTAQMKIMPLPFKDTACFFKEYSHEAQALMYGVTGGIPQYMLMMNPRLSVEDNIKDTYLNPISAMFEEPDNLLKQEVREAALYNAVIQAIAEGSTKLSEIAGKVGSSTGKCANYIRTLCLLGIVKKESPYGEAHSRKIYYSVDDTMFRFWYRFIPRNMALIMRRKADAAYRNIEPYLSDFMGPVFEKICMEYMWDQMAEGKTPLSFDDLGRWWGSDPRTREQIEIDMMGSEGKEALLLGECKWRNQKTDIDVLERLQWRGALFSYPRKYLYLFSKSGFTSRCQIKAKEMGTYLISLDDMMQSWQVHV